MNNLFPSGNAGKAAVTGLNKAREVPLPLYIAPTSTSWGMEGMGGSAGAGRGGLGGGKREGGGLGHLKM